MKWKSSGHRQRRAILLDRDGTLMPDVDYLSRPEQIKLYPETVPVLAKLRQAGYLLIGVTNQSAIARGMISVSDLQNIHNHLQLLLGGSRLDHIYYCPHHPSAGASPWRTDCACRKPKPGMLLQAATEWGIDLGESWMIGDRDSDVEAGQRAGCRTVKLGTSESPTDTPDLQAAARVILVNEEYQR